MRVRKVSPEAPEPEVLAEAARVLREGGVVAFPTETVYGLAAHAEREEALRRLFEIKGRPEGRPLILLVSEPAEVSRLVEEIPPWGRWLMEELWPNGVSLVFRARPGLSPAVTGGSGKVAVRCSGHPVARALARAAGAPITATSANRSGQPPLRDAQAVVRELGEALDLVLDGGPTDAELPSTVVDLTHYPPRVVRPGVVPEEVLASILAGPKPELLREIARQVRIDIVEMLYRARSGHTGGSLSVVEALVSLYFQAMRHRPWEPDWPERDRFVLCKGHAAPALYAVLSRCGYFPREELWTLRRLGSILQGHPDMKVTPGVDFSTGSLGQGLSAANGMALAARLDGRLYRVYALLGDGELQEGQVWEAAMTAAHYRLDNLCALVDFNGLQLDGPLAEVMEVRPLADKWRAFGWHVQEVDGHDVEQLLAALAEAARVRGRPSVIIARTVKGKGVDVFEGNNRYHGRPPSREDYLRAMEQLGATAQP